MTIRLTKKRTEVLNALKHSSDALSAKELHAQLPHIDLTTIYRTLELLVSENFISALHLDATETKYEHQETPHHHAVCTECDKVLHFNVASKELEELLRLKNFSIDQIEVTVRGTCDHGHTP